MHENNPQRQNDVKDRHEGHQSLGKASDPLNAAQKDHGHTGGDDDTQNQIQSAQAPFRREVIIDQDCVDRRHDGIDLGRVSGSKYGDHTKKREKDRQEMPPGGQTVFDEVHGAAHPVAILVSLPVMNRQDNFRILGAHTEQGGDPHPEYRTGPADGDGTGNTCNIARSDRSGQRCTYRLKRSHCPLLRLFLIKNLSQCLSDRIDKAPHLNKAGPYTQIQADSDDADHRGNSPYKTVYCSIDIRDYFHHS